MTIIGTWVEHDRALVWADSEDFQRDRETGRIMRSTGHQLKLAINERTRVAAVGAGDIGGNRCIAAAVAGAHSFDGMFLQLPGLLRSEARDRMDAYLPWPDWVAVAVGYSARCRRLMAAIFDAKLKFAPTYIATSFTLPHVAQSDLLSITGPLDVLPIAQKQERAFEREFEHAGGGTLTVADVRRHSVTVSAFDLAGGYSLPGIPDDLKPMAAPPQEFAGERV